MSRHLDHAGLLAATCRAFGIQTVVFSPGSRNAPLVHAFKQLNDLECLVLPDERAAAFFALGIAQQTGVPVALCCTSGSAVANYLPAITEAHYQKIPLVVLSADRPTQWIDKGDGQTIRQQRIFGDFVRDELQLEPFLERTVPNEVQDRIRQILCSSLFPEPGPVHINVPLEEPLYVPFSIPSLAIEKLPSLPECVENWDEIRQEWGNAKCKLILTGIISDGGLISDAVNRLAEDTSVVVLAETTSNLNGQNIIHGTDRLLATMLPEDEEKFKPELVVTLGNAIISKKIKALVRAWKVPHWHVSMSDENMDTFGTLARTIQSSASDFIHQMQQSAPVESDYQRKWKQCELLTEDFHQEYMANAPFSDLKAYQIILDYTPDYTNVQMGNSAAVRYLQLYPPISTLVYHGNRGVSGIDGSVSTAAGAAWVNAKAEVNTLLLCGDMSFIYDSNALWTKHLTPAFRIAVVNNGGGGIFRIIEGPSGSNHLEEFFEADVAVSIEHLCKAFNVNYYYADSEDALHNVMPLYLYPQENDRPALLEVFTPRTQNSEVLKMYFEYLKTNCYG